MSDPEWEFEERRRFPRIRPIVPIALKLADGVTLANVVHDFSPDGVQLRCTWDEARAFYPSGVPVTAGHHPRMPVRMKLPLASGPIEVPLIFELRYMLPHAPGQICFGCEFVEVRATTRGAIDLYVREAMQPG